MWNLKYNTKQLVYETETDSQTYRRDLWLPSEGNGWIGSLRFECKLLYIGWIDNKVLLYGVGNYVHHHYYSTMEKNMKKNIHMHKYI